MNNIGEALYAVFVAVIVANFLVNTNRVLKAIELCKEGLIILNNKAIIKTDQLITSFYEEVYFTLLRAYCIISDYTNAVKYGRKLLHIYRICGDRTEECAVSIKLATFYISLSQFTEAKELLENALPISIEIGHRHFEAYCYGNLGTVYESVGEYKKAREHHEKSLEIKKEIGDRKGEALSYGHIGTVLQCLGEYKRAREYHLKALGIIRNMGQRKGEASCYGSLGNVCEALGEFKEASEYFKKALVIAKEIGDKTGEACFSGNLGTVLRSQGDYVNAEEHLTKAVAICKEIRDRKREATFYGNLGSVLHLSGNYKKAKEYHEKALKIQTEIGDRREEATSYSNIGTVFQLLGECEKAQQYIEKALAIKKEIGDKKGEATSYGNLGAVFKSLGDYVKAKECLETSMTITKQIGDRQGEQNAYENLGELFIVRGDYIKAMKYFEEALKISKEIGDRKAEAFSYGNLGTAFSSVGEYEKSEEYFTKALTVAKEIGDKQGEAFAKGSIGTLFESLGRYEEAAEHLEEALAIRKEIGDRKGEENDYENLGQVFESLGDYGKAKEYFENALEISIEIGIRRGEAYSYGKLGNVHQFLGEYVEAEECQLKALAISEEIGDVRRQLLSLSKLAWIKIFEEKPEDGLSYLLQCIEKCEDLRGLLRDNDQFKISLSDMLSDPYRLLTASFCSAGSPKDALYVSEFGRARALAELMFAQYSVETDPFSIDLQSWIDTGRIMHKERNCTCLYLTYFDNICMFLWVLQPSGVVHFKEVQVDGTVKERFTGFDILPEERCEDRSLNDVQQEPEPCEEDDRGANQDSDLDLSHWYKMIIAPVADKLEGREVMIVPERSLYNIPFAALLDESGKYLSETFCIRVVPSLMTLKLFQDSPADYHSQRGALIIGNPDVGKVRLKGRRKTFLPLPCAEREAIMIGEKLGVKPLLGQEATKQAVLQVINSVSLIHFAAHGDAERGEIALAALRPSNRIPREEDYLLTMSDISKVQLRAKLVVLSCCHSGRGQIKSEGVVGIARAFLGSGARSVLVALWALEDSATEHFMNRFYEHLVRGESASESLHEAMKWMRCNGFSDVRQWAPFMLIGDNVTFDFGK